MNTSKLTSTPGQLNVTDSVTAENETKPDNESKVDTTSGSRLIVGPDVKLRGAEIQDCDTLVVEGR
ncbi:MAG TPA: polymer-forming cytoskeletal protein, partial [Methylophilaceae bacterium]|nr:polymer-forming cytoskeletal protein [Methylophilaceae bacterium]